jgi:hypothetical protein
MAALTKQQKELIALAALVVVAGLVYYTFFGKGHAGAAGLFQRGPYVPISADDYGKPLQDLAQTRSTEYKPSGRNIFVIGPIAPPPTEVAKAVAPKHPIYDQPQPPPPPPKPVLDMKFFGMGTLPSYGQRRAFLQDGDDVRIVGEGDTLRNHIRITHIGNDRIEYEDVNTGMKNSTNLEMPPPA